MPTPHPSTPRPPASAMQAAPQPRSALDQAFAPLLAVALGLLACWSAIAPASRAVWYAEALPVLAVLAALVISQRWFRFSNLAYFLMSLWMAMHLVGAHYTFANVPFEWGNRLLAPLLGEGRNHFDRLAHFIIGFYSYPMAEWLLRRRLCGPVLACFFALFFIMSVAAAYEIIEWQYAVIEGGDAGIEFLGSQGDVWDAQKDILADTLGALTALGLFLLVRPDRRLPPS
ncbi:DUF2238 domain-containing protein [Vandammella animalimorsus]|nr:DUF2238 domain-containing protein [Vandammella animalimorsus]